MNTHVPAAVLWDMDGTLIDSEPYWIAAETELCAKFGVAWTQQDGLQLVGNSLESSAKVLRERGVLMPSDDIIEHLTGRVTMQVQERAPWQQDAFDLLNAVLAAGIPCALVTMEALACGLPVVTTKLNGGWELLPPQLAALTVESPHDRAALAQQIVQLCHHSNRVQLARVAREAANSWTFEHHYQALLRVFSEVMERKRPSLLLTKPGRVS